MTHRGAPSSVRFLSLAAVAALALTACTAPPVGVVLPGPVAAPAPGGAPAPAGPAVRPALPRPAEPTVGGAPQPAGAAPAAQGAPIIIANNRGGNVVQMMAYRQQLASSGRLVRIQGVCNSACTMLTTLPNACLDPKASIGFHAPRLPNTQIIPPIVDQLMATTYRNGIRARWYNEWRHSLTIKSITAQEYVELDPMTRICPA